jgi:hypothetical protein
MNHPAPNATTPEYDPEADATLSYYAAIAELGRRVRQGQPVPTSGYFREEEQNKGGKG